MNNYILLPKNIEETNDLELVFELPEELREQFPLTNQALTNVTLNPKILDKFFQALPTVSTAIRDASEKLVNDQELNHEMLKTLDFISNRFRNICFSYFVKPYKVTDDMSDYNNLMIKQFQGLIEDSGYNYSHYGVKGNVRTINVLKPREYARQIVYNDKLTLSMNRLPTYTQRKLKEASDFYIAVPVWSELNTSYSLFARKLLSGLRGLLYFLKDLKAPNPKKTSAFFTVRGHFVDSLTLVQFHIDTFIEILESDCFKLNQPTEENLKWVQEKLDVLELKYVFVLSKMKSLYSFELSDNLRKIEKRIVHNSNVSAGKEFGEHIKQEFDYQLTSLGQDVAICRLVPRNMITLLELSMKKYIDLKAAELGLDYERSRKLRIYLNVDCAILTNDFTDIPATLRLVDFRDPSMPDLTIHGLVEDFCPELDNNPDLANVLLNLFVFGRQDVAKFKVVKMPDTENESLQYIYLYAFPNKNKALSL